MPPPFQRICTAFSTVAELMGGLWRGPYWWLVPLVLLILPSALILVFVQAYPVIAPFVYALF
jgi:hypothetical protein